MYVTREVKRSLYMKYERRDDWYDPQTTVSVSRTASDRIVSFISRCREGNKPVDPEDINWSKQLTNG